MATPPIKDPHKKDPAISPSSEQKNPSLNKTDSQTSKIYSGPIVAASSSNISFQNTSSVQDQYGFIEPIVNEIVHRYKQARDLSVEIDLLDLKGDDLDRKSEDYTAHKKKVRDKEKEFQELKIGIENLEKALLLSANKFLNYPQAISHLIVNFSAIISLRFEQSEQEIEFRRGRLINNLRNVCMFLMTTKNILNANKALILKEFCPDIKMDQSELTYYLKPLGDETHNRGQSAVEVHLLNQRGLLLRKIVYKPRNAETEIAILELFKHLNLKKAPSEAELPVFKIVNLGNAGSIWEYIVRADGGGHLQNDAIVELEAMKRTPLYEQAKNNFDRLESVCQAIGVTDLHPENVILRNRIEWVPIDFEVIKVGHVTGLYGKNRTPELKPLKSEEWVLINQFKEHQKGRLFRAVPIATARLGDLGTTPWGGKEIALLFHSVLGKEYEPLIELSEIERLATLDIINGDIPILYQKAGILYYGSEGFKIGKLKEGL